MLKQQTVYKVFRVCLPVTFPPFEGSPRAGAAEYVYRGMLIINKQPAKISKKTLRTIFLLSLPTYKRQETYENLY